MGFFSSVSQVISNRGNYKKWEKEQEDNKAKRQELAQKNPPSKKEFEKAKSQGKVLIDIIDLMDTHSEDVAEKTEAVTVVPEQLLPLAMLTGTGALSAKFLYEPASKSYEQFASKFSLDNSKKFSVWAKQIEDYVAKLPDKHPDIKKLSYFPEYYFEYPSDVKKLKNVEDDNIKGIYKEATKLLNDFKNSKASKNLKSKTILSFAIPVAATVGSFIAGTLIATKLQVNSSRIARWQSRGQLEDPKYFVEYTPEQIAQAQQNLEANKDDKKKGKFSKLFDKSQKASLLKVIKDNKEYKNWKKTDTDDSKKVDRQLSAQELLQAQKDQEVIQRVTKEINNKAEDYSENMEVAADTLIMGTPFLGAGVGAIVGKIVNKLGIMDKFADNKMQKFIGSLEENSADKVKESYAALKGLKKGMPGFKKAQRDFADAVFSSEIKHSKEGFLEMAKKGLNYFSATEGGRNKMIAVIGGTATGIVGAVIGLKLQKASSRAGRFVAKRELEKDPNNFIGYSNEELQSQKDTKAQKQPFGKKFKEYVLFIPNVLKEYFEYKKYTKTQAPKEKALKDELAKLDVSDKQLRDAKNMQRKMFNTFEKVDDKSQEYSEQVEAATQMAKPAIMGLGILTAASPIIIAGIQVARGKLSIAKVSDKITGFLANHTNFLKGKKMDKYLSNVEENVSHAVRNSSKIYGFENYAEKANVIKKGLEGISDNFAESKNYFKDDLLGEIKKIINASEDDSWKEMLMQLLQDKKGFNKLIDSCDKKQAISIINNLQKIVDNVPDSKLEKIIAAAKAELEKNPEQFMQLMENGAGLGGIFFTKDIKKLMGIAGGSWMGINLLATFGIESYLAKLQKEAGRLGVMKALNELEDPAYYANIEVDAAENSTAKALSQTTATKAAEELPLQGDTGKNNKYLL